MCRDPTRFRDNEHRSRRRFTASRSSPGNGGVANNGFDASDDADSGGFRVNKTVVAAPRELKRTAFGCDGREREIRIRGDRGVENCAADFDAVVGAHEPGDDIARQRLAEVIAAKSGFHVVADQRPDIDDLAAFGGLRHVDARDSHG